jgi:hypothetical protein
LLEPSPDGHPWHAQLRAIVEWKLSPWDIGYDVDRTARMLPLLTSHGHHVDHPFGLAVVAGYMWKAQNQPRGSKSMCRTSTAITASLRAADQVLGRYSQGNHPGYRGNQAAAAAPPDAPPPPSPDNRKNPDQGRLLRSYLLVPVAVRSVLLPAVNALTIRCFSSLRAIRCAGHFSCRGRKVQSQLSLCRNGFRACRLCRKGVLTAQSRRPPLRKQWQNPTSLWSCQAVLTA